jgi:hypothetical protein
MPYLRVPDPKAVFKNNAKARAVELHAVTPLNGMHIRKRTTQGGEGY